MLEIKNFSKSYGDKKVVDNLSISVQPGDIYGFIGANGAGKTTTIKAVVGIHDFEDGSIIINGHSTKEEPVICKKMMAYIPDNPDLYEHMTGLQYINFIADLFEIPYFFIFTWNEATNSHYFCTCTFSQTVDFR